MKPRVIGRTKDVSLPPKPLFGYADGDTEKKTAIWDVRKSLALLTVRRETKPGDFFQGSMPQRALDLARKLVADDKPRVEVQILNEGESILLLGQPKVFVTFVYEEQEYQLCSSHFVSDGAYLTG